MPNGPTLPNLDSTFGCLYISVIFSTALWGVGCLQLYLYYEKYFETDKWPLKLYVFLIWVLDTVHQALFAESLYIYFIKEFGNLSYLAHPEATLIYAVIFAALVDMLVQLHFVLRVWHLSKKNVPLTGCLTVVILGQFAATLAYFVQVYQLTSTAQLLTVLGAVRAMNAFVVVADTLISAVLIYLLWHSRSGIRRTDSIIKRLVVYTIGTGLVTSLWGIIGLVGAQVFPASFIYMLVDLVMPKLYFNCMMASLNARSSLRKCDTGAGGALNIRMNGLPTGYQGKKIGEVGAIERRECILGRSEQERNASETDIGGSSTHGDSMV